MVENLNMEAFALTEYGELLPTTKHQKSVLSLQEESKRGNSPSDNEDIIAYFSDFFHPLFLGVLENRLRLSFEVAWLRNTHGVTSAGPQPSDLCRQSWMGRRE